jgi:hypothetical protein
MEGSAADPHGRYLRYKLRFTVFFFHLYSSSGAYRSFAVQ